VPPGGKNAELDPNPPPQKKIISVVPTGKISVKFDIGVVLQ
jgi:hypothetical protein